MIKIRQGDWASFSLFFWGQSVSKGKMPVLSKPDLMLFMVCDLNHASSRRPGKSSKFMSRPFFFLNISRALMYACWKMATSKGCRSDVEWEGRQKTRTRFSLKMVRAAGEAVCEECPSRTRRHHHLFSGLWARIGRCCVFEYHHTRNLNLPSQGSALSVSAPPQLYWLDFLFHSYARVLFGKVKCVFHPPCWRSFCNSLVVSWSHFQQDWYCLSLIIFGCGGISIDREIRLFSTISGSLNVGGCLREGIIGQALIQFF